MKSAKKPAVEVPADVPWENPLIPNKKLRQIYTAMAELRLLSEHLAAQSRRRSNPHIGEEAILASTVLSLSSDDLTSSPSSSAAIRYLLTDRLDAPKHDTNVDKSRLPALSDSTVRLHLALGAALVSARKPALVLAYVYPDELPAVGWKSIFRLASAQAAAVLFVAMPSREKPTMKPGRLSAIATASGVPGIPVDAADAVALHRVVQESMHRTRAGGGPALMECIAFQLPGRKPATADPVLAMRDSLLHRKVAEDAWFTSVATRFAARLHAATL